MRELRFRVWDKVDYMSSPFTLDDLMLKKIQFTNDCPVMQFTGLEDKNGKEIYEGDIIEFDKNEWGGEGNIHVVSWDNESGEWCWGGGTTSDMGYRKIIGNIYQNPELR